MAEGRTDESITTLRKQLEAAGTINVKTLGAQLKGKLRPLFLEVVYGSAATAEMQMGFYEKVAAQLDGVRHRWMENDHFQQIMLKSAARGSQIYWTEIIYRAHIAAALAFLRSLNWISGALVACEKENIHVLSASLRGFLESAADINSTFKYVSNTLATNFRAIREAIRGKAKVVLLNRDLEDRLIHFTHARNLKKGEEAPPSHRALKAGDYFEEMGVEFGLPAKEAYDPLCALTHPSALSTACFLDVEQTELFDTTEIGHTYETLHAAALIVRHGEAFRNAVYLSFNHALIALRVVHAFPLSETKLPLLEKINFSQIAVWRQCADALRRQGIPA